MRKYWTFFIIEWQQAINHRPEAFVWFLMELAPLVIMLNLAIYLKNQGRLNHQEYSLLVLYYVVNLLVSRLSSVHFEDELIDEIKDGKISPAFLKPFSFYWHLLPREASWRLSGMLYVIPSLLLLLPLMGSLAIPHLTFTNVCVFILSLLICYLQRYFFAWLICVPAFWFEQSKVLVHLRWIAEGVLGGAWLPLYLFPLWWQKFASFTPFYYWFYFPVQLILGKVSDIPVSLIISLSWMIILYVISRLFWRFGLKYYSSVGG